MFITKEDFYSHLYEETIDMISRDDDNKVDEAINIGLQTAARYLTKYDVAALYASTNKAPYAELITYIKDIAKWHFIAVCNVSVDLALAEIRYNAAIKNLQTIQKGGLIAGWPITATTTDKPFRSGSREKFNHSIY